MNKYILNGERMRSRAGAHDEIALALSLPAHYGRNLDALWDVASTLEGEILLAGAPAMLNSLGAYGCKLLQTLFEAAEENPRLRLTLE